MRLSETSLEDLIDVGGNGTRKVLGQLRQVRASQQMICRPACVAGLLLEPAEVHANALDGVDARSWSEAARMHPFEPGRDVGAIEGVERDGLSVEPDVELAKARPVTA